MDLTPFLDDLNERYLELHYRKESAFWDTRMGIKDRGNELTEADLALREFLGDPEMLAELRRRKADGSATPEQDVVLDGWILTFERNQVEDEDARAMLRELTTAEEELQRARGTMNLGFVAEDGSVEPASSVALGNAVRTDPDPARRAAAFRGLRSIENFALDAGYVDILKLRNRFARKLGYEDFYDYKTQWAEGFDKKTLFGFLDDLE
ncbi:MAG: hypothetical protein HKN12_07845, partial [Gemmatimonadetes bacterium]|nr:hypothetical protein [Gemmatimonadota bacterium]